MHDAIDIAVLYVGGAVVCIVVLLGHTGLGGFGTAVDAGRFQVFQFTGDILTNPYAFVTGDRWRDLRHGVARLRPAHRPAGARHEGPHRGPKGHDRQRDRRRRAVRTVLARRRAALGPRQGGLVGRARRPVLGQIFPAFILDRLPVGLSGLLFAGILSATMRSLSSALNSLSNSTVADVIHAWMDKRPSGEQVLRIARWSTLVWAAVTVASRRCSPTPPTRSWCGLSWCGLSITGYTYGALLGAFILGVAITPVVGGPVSLVRPARPAAAETDADQFTGADA